MGAVAAFGTCSRERQQLQVKSPGQGPPACPAETGGGESHLGEEWREEDGEEEEQPHRHGRQPRAAPAPDAGRRLDVDDDGRAAGHGRHHRADRGAQERPQAARERATCAKIRLIREGIGVGEWQVAYLPARRMPVRVVSVDQLGQRGQPVDHAREVEDADEEEGHDGRHHLHVVRREVDVLPTPNPTPTQSSGSVIACGPLSSALMGRHGSTARVLPHLPHAVVQLWQLGHLGGCRPVHHPHHHGHQDDADQHAALHLPPPPSTNVPAGMRRRGLPQPPRTGWPYAASALLSLAAS